MRAFILILSFLFTSSVFASVFGSYNIRNFDYDVRSKTPTNKSELKKVIQTIDVDFLAVQEINDTQDFEIFITTNFPKKKVVLSKCGGAHGQRLGFVYDSEKFSLLKFEEDLRVSNVKHSHNYKRRRKKQKRYRNDNDNNNDPCNNGSRPLAIGTFKKKDSGETFVAITVHLKSGGHKNSVAKRFAQLKILSEVVSSFRTSGQNNFVIMGDFNTTEYSRKSKSYKKFTALVKDMGLVDLSKNMKCSSYWWGGIDDGKQYPSLLDHILISPSLTESNDPKASPSAHCKQLSCNVSYEHDMGVKFDEVSDHCPVVSNF